MIVVIFRAKIRNIDQEYAQTAERMRELALGEFGCLEFHSVTGGDEEISLSYWSSEADIHAWKSHPEHVIAQNRGKTFWYESCSFQVATITREYGTNT